jgi:hypothetical protein
MKVYESIGTFDPTNKEFSFIVQATKISPDIFEINQYFDICDDVTYAIVAILSTKDGNDKDLTNYPPDYTFGVCNISYEKLDTALKQKDDLDINTAINGTNEIVLYVHHAIGFDINNPDDKAVLEDYKKGILPALTALASVSPPAKGGKGVLL